VGLLLGVHGELNNSDLKMKSGVEEVIDLLFYSNPHDAIRNPQSVDWHGQLFYG